MSQNNKDNKNTLDTDSGGGFKQTYFKKGTNRASTVVFISLMILTWIAYIITGDTTVFYASLVGTMIVSFSVLMVQAILAKNK